MSIVVGGRWSFIFVRFVRKRVGDCDIDWRTEGEGRREEMEEEDEGMREEREEEMKEKTQEDTQEQE